jgi:hypothetical protein
MNYRLKKKNGCTFADKSFIPENEISYLGNKILPLFPDIMYCWQDFILCCDDFSIAFCLFTSRMLKVLNSSEHGSNFKQTLDVN